MLRSHLYTARARSGLPRVDPGRCYGGSPVGLRDGAVLALLAGGLTMREITTLRADAITFREGRLHIALHRDGLFYAVLPVDLGSRLLAWLTERRLWGTAEPVFTGPFGPLTLQGIHHILNRYRPAETPPPPRRRRRTRTARHTEKAG